ncbi:MAG: hypothetical protein JNL95_07695 [Chitinophagales bacterium]|nr:hypothetical protein [Chitinophagales bacterium]
MKNNISFFKTLQTTALLFVLNCTYANLPKLDNYGFPFYDDVVNYVKTRVSPFQHEEHESFKLAKTTEGWFLLTIAYENNTNPIKTVVKCWDKSTNNFVAIGQQRSEDEANSVAKDFEIIRNDRHCFDKFPCYGYPRWQSDIIAIYKDSADLSDEKLYALGKAYSAYAADLINDPSYFSVNSNAELSYRLPYQSSSMTAKQIERYKECSENSIRTYKRLWEQNPQYETFVGNIYTKYCNEIVHVFIALWMHHGLDVATNTLPDSLYDPFFITTSQNALSSCEKNAILFTNGDNDTYPLYYLQLKYHFRTDVLVVNWSLLGKDRYIDAIRRKFLDAQPFPSTFKSEEYRDNGSLDYLLIDNPLYVKLFKHTGLITKREPATIYKNEILFLNMLSTNKWERAVYFCNTVSSECFMGFDANLQIQGSAYKLTTKRSSAKNYDDAPVNSKYSLKYYQHDFKPACIKQQPFIDINIKAFVANHRLLLNRLCETLIAEKQTKNAETILDSCKRWFPENTFPLDVYCASYPSFYIQIGRREKADIVAKKLLCYADSLYTNNIDNQTMGKSEWSLMINMSLYILQELKSTYEPLDNTPEEINKLLAIFDERYKNFTEKAKVYPN